jgi:hypothetical protein
MRSFFSPWYCPLDDHGYNPLVVTTGDGDIMNIDDVIGTAADIPINSRHFYKRLGQVSPGQGQISHVVPKTVLL